MIAKYANGLLRGPWHAYTTENKHMHAWYGKNSIIPVINDLPRQDAVGNVGHIFPILGPDAFNRGFRQLELGLGSKHG